MKIILNIKELLEEGKINQSEYDKLLSLSKTQTGSVSLNLLIGFGIIMMCVGIIALSELPTTALITGILTFLVGMLIRYKATEEWSLLASCCAISGILVFVAGINLLSFDSNFLNGAIWIDPFYATILTSCILAVSSAFLMSNILSVLSILSIANLTGAGTSFFGASYTIWISSPIITVCIFSFLALLLYFLSRSILLKYEKILIAGSRTSVLMVNVGFWVGSIWGGGTEDFEIAAELMSVSWALAIIGFGVWGWRANRRWVVAVASIFGATHFYTQLFNILDVGPASIVVAGVIAIGIGVGIKRLDSAISVKRN